MRRQLGHISKTSHMSKISIKHPRSMALSVTRGAMFMHKNRKYMIESKRSYARKAPEAKCENTTCGKKKSPFWASILPRQKRRTTTCEDEEKEATKVPLHCCRLKYYTDRRDPDLSELGGQAYRTCGLAYLIQRDLLPEKDDDESDKEDRILRRIEAHPALKDFVDEPTAEFKDVPQRLLQLSERKLHPSYMKLRATPPKRRGRAGPRNRGGVALTAAEEEPSVRIRIESEALERKNINVEYKRTSPP